MNAIIEWLKHAVTIFGLSAPAWSFCAIAAGLAFENVLSHLQAPWAKSTLGIIAMGLRWLVKFTRIASIPAVGPALVRLFETIANVDLDGDGKVGDPSPPVRIIALFLAGGLAVAASGCATVQPIVKDVETCAGPACADIATKILPAAEVILECELETGGAALPACAENGLAALAAAAGPDGWKIVACVVSAIEKDTTKPPAVRERARMARPVVAMHKALGR